MQRKRFISFVDGFIDFFDVVGAVHYINYNSFALFITKKKETKNAKR